MGGRGASSGISDSGKEYGTEFRTLHQDGRIKFVTPVNGAATAPLETMTRGRVYVTVNEKNNSLKSISFYDRENKRFRQIDLDHYHRINGAPVKPHVQSGYLHDGEASLPSEKDRILIDKVFETWQNR